MTEKAAKIDELNGKGIEMKEWDFESRNVQTVNIWNIYRDLERLLQPIKDKQKNIWTLNRKNFFPLKRIEIDEFMLFIEKSMNELDSYCFNLYLERDPETLFYDAQIRHFKAHAETAIGKKLSDDEKNEFKSLMLSLYMIYKECPNRRIINGLKKRIENIKSQIIESNQHEEFTISRNQYRREALINDAIKPKKAVNE